MKVSLNREKFICFCVGFIIACVLTYIGWIGVSRVIEKDKKPSVKLTNKIERKIEDIHILRVDGEIVQWNIYEFPTKQLQFSEYPKVIKLQEMSDKMERKVTDIHLAVSDNKLIQHDISTYTSANGVTQPRGTVVFNVDPTIEQWAKLREKVNEFSTNYKYLEEEAAKALSSFCEITRGFPNSIRKKIKLGNESYYAYYLVLGDTQITKCVEATGFEKTTISPKDLPVHILQAIVDIANNKTEIKFVDEE